MAGVPQSTSQQRYDVAEPSTPAGNSRKFREDYDKVMGRLADQAFNPINYRDPMIPLQGSNPQYYPKGVTLEMEKVWLAKIESVRNTKQ